MLRKNNITEIPLRQLTERNDNSSYYQDGAMVRPPYGGRTIAPSFTS